MTSTERDEMLRQAQDHCRNATRCALLAQSHAGAGRQLEEQALLQEAVEAAVDGLEVLHRLLDAPK